MFDDSAAGVLGARCHTFCFTTPLREGLELNSAKFELRTWPLLCAECVESANQKVPHETTCVSPPQFRIKTNCCCLGPTQSIAASQSSSVKAPLEERDTWFCLLVSQEVTEPPVIEDPLGSR